MFREKTGLQNIQITLPGGYREILKLIQCFQCSECPNNQSTREQCQKNTLESCRSAMVSKLLFPASEK